MKIGKTNPNILLDPQYITFILTPDQIEMDSDTIIFKATLPNYDILDDLIGLKYEKNSHNRGLKFEYLISYDILQDQIKLTSNIYTLHTKDNMYKKYPILTKILYDEFNVYITEKYFYKDFTLSAENETIIRKKLEEFIEHSENKPFDQFVRDIKALHAQKFEQKEMDLD